MSYNVILYDAFYLRRVNFKHIVIFGIFKKSGYKPVKQVFLIIKVKITAKFAVILFIKNEKR